MGARGPDFYDDDRVFATYTAHRQRAGNPNEALEKPIFLELLGAVTGLRVLDLGCGDAAFGRELLRAGCRGYVGLEASRNMLAAAREQLAGTPAQVVRTTIEDWAYPAGAFDLVISRLALHYVEDVEALFTQVFRTLIDGGRFIFSVEHPVITSCNRGWPAGTPRQDWVVDDYHVVGPRLTRWLGGEVIKYHRTVEDYFGTLQRTGFAVEALREARPERERFAEEEAYVRRRRIPLFLLLAARKGATG
jgi:SAM-dependent methyltransferase